MGEVAAREENEKHVPPRPLAHRLDSIPALVPRSGLDPPTSCKQKKLKTSNESRFQGGSTVAQDNQYPVCGTPYSKVCEALY